MATRRTTGRASSNRGGATRRTSRTARRTTSSAGRAPTGRLYPRRRRSKPGLPTTVGTALGTLVVTTLLGLAWPVRVGLIAVVVVVGLGYVLWRRRSELAAGVQVPEGDTDGAPAPETPEQT